MLFEEGDQNEDVAQNPEPQRAYPLRGNRRAPTRFEGTFDIRTYIAQLKDHPTTLNEVKKRPDWPMWKEAMNIVLKALRELGTFTLSKLPPGSSAISCR
jgi:hypothetical protein